MGNENTINRAMSEDRPQGTEDEPVDIIASGYEWICPRCNTLNKEIEWTSLVTCENWKCRVGFFTKMPEHALGK